MSDMPLALLVANGSTGSLSLKAKLESMGMAVYAASDCVEAALLLHSHTPPHLVFTDMQLPDGSWSGIISLVETAKIPTSVIVVSMQVNIDSYLQTLERGAFDFIVPPFELSEFDHIVRSALGNVKVRRQLQQTTEMEKSRMNDDTCAVDSCRELTSSL